MGLTTKTLGELLDYMDSDSERLKLPEIQREFVWNKQNIKLLFDSLYRELPIGQMLVWKPTETSPKSVGFSGKSNRVHPSKVDQFYGYLLDGQQRLTAISRIRDADDKYPLLINLYPEKEKDDELFFWDRVRGYNNPWYVRVSEVLRTDFSIVGYIEILSKDDEFKEQHGESVRKTLTAVQGILKYVVSVVEFEKDNYYYNARFSHKIGDSLCG